MLPSNLQEREASLSPPWGQGLDRICLPVERSRGQGELEKAREQLCFLAAAFRLTAMSWLSDCVSSSLGQG